MRDFLARATRKITSSAIVPLGDQLVADRGVKDDSELKALINKLRGELLQRCKLWRVVDPEHHI